MDEGSPSSGHREECQGELREEYSSGCYCQGESREAEGDAPLKQGAVRGMAYPGLGPTYHTQVWTQPTQVWTQPAPSVGSSPLKFECVGPTGFGPGIAATGTQTAQVWVKPTQVQSVGPTGFGPGIAATGTQPMSSLVLSRLPIYWPMGNPTVQIYIHVPILVPS